MRKAAHGIGEKVSCDARYIGRVEAGEIRCPNYAYERVFLHMFPGRTLTDLGFSPREAVRGRASRRAGAPTATLPVGVRAGVAGSEREADPRRTHRPPHDSESTTQTDEESDVLRRAFMTGGPAALATAPLWSPREAHAAGAEQVSLPGLRHRPGALGRADAATVEEAVRRIRLLDDRHGADDLYQRADLALRRTYELLDSCTAIRSVSDSLQANTGELALSVGWLAHDSERYDDARSHYGEALALARVIGDRGLEAHAFCNGAFLASDAGRPREALRAAQAGQQAARGLGQPRLESLLAMREAEAWSGLGDRAGCQAALSRAHTFFDRAEGDGGPDGACPEWMSFFCAAELAGLESRAWAALGEWRRAAACARRAVALQPPHFVRNRALFTAELAHDLAAGGELEEAAHQATAASRLLGTVRSVRVNRLLSRTAVRLAS